MVMKFSKHYISSDKQIKQYKDLCKAVLNSQKFKDNIKELNIPKQDIDLYLSYLFLENTTQLNLYMLQMIKEPDTTNIRKISSQILTSMYKQLLRPTGTLTSFISLHNSNFKNLNTSAIDFENPLLVSTKQVANEFDNNKNSNIELYAKNMLWSSRLAKQAEAVRKNIVKTSCPNPENSKEIFECTNAYDRLKNKLLTTITKDGEALSEAFLQDYSSYIYGDIESKKVLKRTATYKQINKMIMDTKSSKKYNITPDSLFKYISCMQSTTYLYQIKEKNIDLIVQQYANLTKADKAKNIRLSRSIDPLKSKEKYNSDFTVNISKYNTDFKVHSDSRFLDDLEKKYNITLEETKIATPFKPYMVYRFSQLQRSQIETLAKSNIRHTPTQQAILDYEINRFNTEKQIVKGGKEEDVR